MASNIEQRILALISTWPTASGFADTNQRFAHTCTSHTCDGLAQLLLEYGAVFDVQYNMPALIRTLASANCRVEYLEDPVADLIYNEQVWTVQGLKTKNPTRTWIAHSHRPHARSSPHARSRVEAVVFLTSTSGGLRVCARRLTMPSEHYMMSYVIGSHMPGNYALTLYTLSRQYNGLPFLFLSKLSIGLGFDLVLTPNGEYRPRLNDADLWPALLPLIAQERIHSNGPVLEYVHRPTQTELEAILTITSAHVYCVFRHVGHHALLIVTAEPYLPDNFSSGRRAIFYIPLPPPH
jgi:hypothetical protein